MQNDKKNAALNEKEKLYKLIIKTVNALEGHDYKTYIRCLDQLGKTLNILYQKNNPDYHQLNDSALKENKIAWLKKYIEAKFHLSDALPYCVFEEAWIDEHLKEPIRVNGVSKYRRFLSPKANLNSSIRRRINLGMRAIALAINTRELSYPTDQDTAAHLDEKACRAIKSYKTEWQKILENIGLTLAVIMSVVCSIVTAGAVAITLAAWPVALAGVIVGIVFTATLIINLFSYRTLVPRILNDMFGKDYFFAGWTVYRDSDTGEKIPMSFARKMALGVSSLGACILGLATGAVTYGFILGLGKLALLPFLAAGTVGALFLPPLGVIIAAVFCMSSIIFMMKPILNFIRAKNVMDILSKPFENTAMIFDPSNPKNEGKSARRLRIEKILIYSLLGVMSAFTLFGLVVLQVQNGVALANFLSHTKAISSAIAVGLAHMISMSSVLIGQLPYALNSLSETLVVIVAWYRNFFSHTADKNPKEPSPISPRIIKEKVVNGIKETIKILAPNKSIANDATTARLIRLYRLLNKPTQNTVIVESSLSASDEEKENKQPRIRYYQQYLFANDHAHHTTKNTPKAPTAGMSFSQ